jgi:4-amino-4-deoxychorismate lyase
VIKVLINGKAVDCVASSDRGLLYGDGLFETIAVVSGSMRHWPRHLSRLQAGCDRLGIPAVNEVELENECQSLAGNADKAVLKVLVTRGSGGRGYRTPDRPSPTRIVQLHEWPAYSPACAERGVAVRVCNTRLGHNPALAGIKHLNRLEQVLARQEWEDKDIMEGLLLDSAGHLIEGTMSNIFLVRDGTLLTPDLHRCGVAGIMRTQIMELAGRLPIDVQVGPVEMQHLQEADEVFICNSLIGIWPVIAVDASDYKTGDYKTMDYKKGTVTARLQALLDSFPDTANVWQT